MIWIFFWKLFLTFNFGLYLEISWNLLWKLFGIIRDFFGGKRRRAFRRLACQHYSILIKPGMYSGILRQLPCDKNEMYQTERSTKSSTA